MAELKAPLRTRIKREDEETDNITSRSEHTETLNFRVTSDFKREYKGYAVSQGMTMIELLKEGFEMSKAKRGR